MGVGTCTEMRCAANDQSRTRIPCLVLLCYSKCRDVRAIGLRRRTSTHMRTRRQDNNPNKKFWSTKDPDQKPFQFQIGKGVHTSIRMTVRMSIRTPGR